MDFNLSGAKYTYSDHQQCPKMSRIDRFLVTSSWIEQFDEHSEQALRYNMSDHRVLLLEKCCSEGAPHPFKFELLWLEKQELIGLMENWWNEIDASGKPGFAFNKKLKGFDLKIKDYQKILGELEQKEEQVDLSSQELDLKEETKQNLQHQLNLEETYWFSRAKTKWNKEGERCTGYFHRIANARFHSNSISKLKIDGQWEKDQAVIKKHIVDYYTTVQRRGL
ncbi:hypothetical protein IFM89_012735 [Coptis chinensis]|uniref:Uncharacterized protein n=1 Tax=Coptis chinensis TaxID=261450 RepID=A0A835HE54_9MAGN|nr:hypothetical protein IFM89_012735 [Coptis chinensis]